MNARIGVDLSQLKAMPAAARAAGQATARELQNALKQAAAQQAAVENQRTAAMQAALTQRRVAVRAAAREEIEATRQVAAQQAAVERQRTAELKAALRQRVVAVKAAAREEALAQRASQVSAGAFRRGAATFAGAAFGGPLGGLAGAVAGGTPALAAGLAVSEGVRAAVEASQLATEYGRQEVAALSLAGSQAKLNDLMVAYERASGGAVDKATALADVTRLMATGFGKTAVEIERFTRGARGASIAMGKPQDYIIQEVQLAISNTSFRRLDQIGLGIAEVTTRMGELRAANGEMTREMAFNEAVLGLLNQKFGALTNSAEGQKTELEKLGIAWKNFRLEMGQTAKPSVDETASWFTSVLNRTKKFYADLTAEDEKYAAAKRKLGQKNGGIIWPWEPDSRAGNPGADPVPRWMTSATPRAAPAAVAGRFDGERGQDQLAAINQWDAAKLDISRRANEAINAETRQAGQQRVSIIANYEKSIAREAEDFGRHRANAERKLQMSILDVAQDSARQRVKWEADLARNIAQAQADSGERVADAQRDTSKRLAELDEDFKEDQARREEDFRDDMLSAAGRLDAIALLELRKGRARELEDSKKAHDEQRTDLQAQLQERIDEERENLAERIQESREAHQRQVQEQAENDRLRIADMQEAFAEQKAQENIERGIRLTRQAEDHTQQLIEFDRAHGERLHQIRANAAKERTALDEEFEKEMDGLGIRTKAYEKAEIEREKRAIASFDRFYKHMEDRFEGREPKRARRPGELRPYASGGYVGATGPIYAHRGEFILSPAMLAGNMPIPPAVSSAVTHNSSSRSITIAPGAFVVNAAPGMDEARIVTLMVEYFEEIAPPP